MQFTQYTDVHEFHRATNDILMQHEAQNVIPLGNVLIGVKGEDKTSWRDPANWFMATVSDYSGIRLTAIMTPPMNLTLYATGNQNDPGAIVELIEGMVQTGISIPGVMAEKSLTEMFASIYTGKHNLTHKVVTSQRIYELTQVNPAVAKAGIRLANERDLAYLPYWDSGFLSDCFAEHSGHKVSGDIEEYRYLTRQGRIYIMEEAYIPVTMAKISRELYNVCVIGYVYTPPYFRKKGYATACVAAVSQIGLNQGYKKCVLYTDLSNPTSNSIYQKIGYKPVCDSDIITFE
ncbi:MAG: GNAT family N-acetyltransferase [Defluviitaleaceae bacterium]|nr:GNAT family N-acetyltransferase [Defluviitaleaceae bacterium]